MGLTTGRRPVPEEPRNKCPRSGNWFVDFCLKDFYEIADNMTTEDVLRIKSWLEFTAWFLSPNSAPVHLHTVKPEAPRRPLVRSKCAEVCCTELTWSDGAYAPYCSYTCKDWAQALGGNQ